MLAGEIRGESLGRTQHERGADGPAPGDRSSWCDLGHPRVLADRDAESLYDLYGNDKPRISTYLEMVDTALRHVRQGMRVCLVFYGHPGMFAFSPHEAIRIARDEGYRAELVPGISTEAALFADLGIDPSHFGWQGFDATELLINNRAAKAIGLTIPPSFMLRADQVVD